MYRWALEKNNFAIDTSTWLRSKRRASTLTGQNLTGNKFSMNKKAILFDISNLIQLHKINNYKTKFNYREY